MAGESFRAPDLDVAEIRDAYEQGVRAGTRTRPSAEELERLEGMGREAERAYWLGARDERIQAPPSWPLEGMLLAGESALTIWASDVDGPQKVLVKGPPSLALAAFIAGARKRAQRRRARQLGLTRLTAPRPIFQAWIFVLALVALPYRLYRRHRRGIVERPDWPLMVARNVIAHLARRRSWARAMRARTHPSH
jgi:hypothetical protein